MNRETKKVVYKILENEKKARVDDYYLILRTIEEMTDIKGSTPIDRAFSTIKEKGISFESITRARRKWLEVRPEIRENLRITKKREEEEKEYILEYGESKKEKSNMKVTERTLKKYKR